MATPTVMMMPMVMTATVMMLAQAVQAMMVLPKAMLMKKLHQ
jgi:hypothetical protein